MLFLEETTLSSIPGLPSRKALAGRWPSWRTARAQFVHLWVTPTADVDARTEVARMVANHPAESENVENNGFVLDGVYVSSSLLSVLQPRPKLGHTLSLTLVFFSNCSQRPPFAFYEIIRIFGRAAQVRNPYWTPKGVDCRGQPRGIRRRQDGVTGDDVRQPNRVNHTHLTDVAHV